MPENETANAGETTTTTAAEAKAFEPIQSQEDLDRIIQKRIERERARFTDYDELKAAAEKLAQIEEANKTETEKATERLAAAEKRAAELEIKAARAEVAAAKGVPSDLLTGTTRAELETAADALIAFRGEQGSNRLHVPNEGKSPVKAGNSDEREFVKTLFNTAD